MCSAAVVFGVVSLLGWSEPAHAQATKSQESVLGRADRLRREAEAAWQAGSLTAAREAALKSVETEPSNITERARRVLVNVALAEGDLDAAGKALSALLAVPYLPPTAKAWADRAGIRLVVERAESRGDASSALEGLASIQAQTLDPDESAWAARLGWRLRLRTLEQSRALDEASAQIEAAASRKDLSAEDGAWLVGARGRVEILKLEQGCRWPEMGARLDGLQSAPTLRPADRLWAEATRTRLRLREADAADRDTDAAEILNQIRGDVYLSAHERAWTEGYLTRLTLKQAIKDKDLARIEELWAGYEAWAKDEPPLAKLVRPKPKEKRPPPRAWAALGALGGYGSWRQTPTETCEGAGDLEKQTCEHYREVYVCAEPGGCDGPVAGLSGGAVVPLWRHLGVRGALTLFRPLSLGVDGLESAGGLLVDARLGVAWMESRWSASVGPSLRSAPSVVRLDTHGYEAVGISDLLVAASGQGELPAVGLDGALDLGFSREDLAGDLGLGWSFGKGSWRPRVGVIAGLALGSEPVELTDLSVNAEAGAKAGSARTMDWNAGITIGFRWRRREP